METIKLQYQDLLICDPCYIKAVKSNNQLRYDALKHVKTIHEGSDGEYPIQLASRVEWLGVNPKTLAKDLDITKEQLDLYLGGEGIPDEVGERIIALKEEMGL